MSWGFRKNLLFPTLITVGDQRQAEAAMPLATLNTNPSEGLPAELASKLDEKGAAEVLGVSIPTLRRWRLMKLGPRYFKPGDGPRAVVRYSVVDLRDWLADRAVLPQIRCRL